MGGIRVGVVFRIGGGTGTAMSLAGFSISPVRNPYTGDRASMVPADGRSAALTLGLSTLGTVGTGMLIRALKGDKDVASAKNIGLDSGVGLMLGCGLIGDPRAEAAFSGAIFSLPLAWLNHRKDPSRDFRIDMLTQGGVALLREMLGDTPIPFKGYENNPNADVAGETQTKGWELFGNSMTEIGMDALCYGLGNTLSSLMQGHTDKGSLIKTGVNGMLYGSGVCALENLCFGSPVRLDQKTKDDAVRIASENGLDIADVIDHTTFRTGGLMGVIPLRGITLGQNVWLTSKELRNPTLVSHEEVHRDQIGGSWARAGDGEVRQGHGFFSFYPEYLIYSGQYGYNDNPFELEPDGMAQTDSFKSMPGDFTANLINQGLFALGTLYLTPKKSKSTENLLDLNTKRLATNSKKLVTDEKQTGDNGLQTVTNEKQIGSDLTPKASLSDPTVLKSYPTLRTTNVTSWQATRGAVHPTTPLVTRPSTAGSTSLSLQSSATR